MMKKILLASILVSFLVLPAASLAVEAIPDLISSEDDIIAIIETIANWIFAILLAVALIFILIAAFQFLTSGGSPERVGQARANLLYAVIGIAVGFLARGFVTLVRLVLGVAEEPEAILFFTRFFS